MKKEINLNEESLSRRPDHVYLTWQDGEDEQYFNQYFSLNDAVVSEDPGTVIFKASVKALGTFQVVTKLVKTKKSNKKKKVK